jgi:hypothetical protein
MRNGRLFLDLPDVKLSNANFWKMITLPIRLLGAAAIDSGSGSIMRHPVIRDVCLRDTRSGPSNS